MKKFTFPAIGIALLFVAGFFTSCKVSEDYDYFLVNVDNIVAPDEIYANEPFEVELIGIIGYDGCSGFERFITERQDSVLIVEAWGKSRTNTSICPDVVVELSREKFKYTIDTAGTYILKAKQPDGSYLEQQIEVR